MLRFGYPCINRQLREEGVMVDRTARLSTIEERGIGFVRDLYKANLHDLLEILQWNVAHGITFYRVSSSIAPHVTNDKLIGITDNDVREDEDSADIHNYYKRLAYRLDCSAARKVAKYVRQHDLRLTFHADHYVVLASPNVQMRVRSMRDIYYHYKLMKVLGLGDETVVIVHGGGTYGDKIASMNRWLDTYMAFEPKVRARVVLENDEYDYNVEDVLNISEQVASMNASAGKRAAKVGVNLPIVFDIFHYNCHNLVRRERGLAELPPAECYLARIVDSWKRAGRADWIKMHLSEQKPDAPLGAHSDYVQTVPKFMLDFPKTFGLNLDVMIETKQGERSALLLMKKYKSVLAKYSRRHVSRKGGDEEQLVSAADGGAPVIEDTIDAVSISTINDDGVASNDDSGDAVDSVDSDSTIGGADAKTVYLLGVGSAKQIIADVAERYADYKFKSVTAEDNVSDAELIVTRGTKCGWALKYQASHYMLRGLVLIEPDCIEDVVPNNVIVHHCKPPLGVEKYYKHFVADCSVEAIVDSISELLGRR